MCGDLSYVKEVSHWGTECVCVLPGAALEEVNRHWDWLVYNLLRSLSVFENKDDLTNFVKGKVKVTPPSIGIVYCMFKGQALYIDVCLLF